MPQVVVATFYKFVPLSDYRVLKPRLEELCERLELKGSILLAEEGINATVAGSEAGINGLLNFLREDPRLSDLTWKESHAEEPPFGRMKVRLKREIVTMGVPQINPREKVGAYVTADQWNTLLDDPEVVLVDTRNDYEVEIGTFEGAIDPALNNFREFPRWAENNLDPRKHRKVAMFCTGGIRCEKASAYLLEQGFEEVYHLRDGILKYLETVPAEQSRWRGDCFVFDERVAVGHGLALRDYVNCEGCGRPLSPAQRRHPAFEDGICCEFCRDRLSDDKRVRLEEKRRQRQLAEQRLSND